jgi:hypothetical protein
MVEHTRCRKQRGATAGVTGTPGLILPPEHDDRGMFLHLEYLYSPPPPISWRVGLRDPPPAHLHSSSTRPIRIAPRGASLHRADLNRTSSACFQPQRQKVPGLSESSRRGPPQRAPSGRRCPPVHPEVDNDRSFGLACTTRRWHRPRSVSQRESPIRPCASASFTKSGAAERRRGVAALVKELLPIAAPSRDTRC